MEKLQTKLIYYIIDESVNQWKQVYYRTEWDSNRGIDYSIPPEFVASIYHENGNKLNVFAGTSNSEQQENLQKFMESLND